MRFVVRKRWLIYGAIVKVERAGRVQRVKLNDSISARNLDSDFVVIGGVLPPEADGVRVHVVDGEELDVSSGRRAWATVLRRSDPKTVDVEFTSGASALTRDRFVVEELLPASWTSYAPLAPPNSPFAAPWTSPGFVDTLI